MSLGCLAGATERGSHVLLTPGISQMANTSDRLTIRLSPAAMEAVEEIQKLGGFKTPQEAIRRAIADERFLQRWQNDGWQVLLRKGRSYRELVWPSL